MRNDMLLIAFAFLLIFNSQYIYSQQDTLDIVGKLKLIKSPLGDQIYNVGVSLGNGEYYGNKIMYPKNSEKVIINLKEKLSDKYSIYSVSGDQTGELMITSALDGMIVGFDLFDELIISDKTYYHRGVNLYPVYTRKDGKQGLIFGDYQLLLPKYGKVDFWGSVPFWDNWLVFNVENEEGTIDSFLYNYQLNLSFGQGLWEHYFVYQKNKDFIYLRKDGKYGLGTKTGKLVVQPKYDKISVGAYGKIAFLINNDNKAGMADLEQGKVILPPEYDDIRIYGSSAPYNLIVTKDGKEGYFHTFYKMRIDPKYEKLYYKSCNERLVFKENGKYGLVDKKGRELVPALYDDYYFYPSDESKMPTSCARSLFAVKKGDKIAPYSLSKDEVLDDFKYDTVVEVSDYEIVMSSADGKTYSFDKDGKKRKVN